MAKHYQVCPVEPVDGACPQSLEWVAVEPAVDIDVFVYDVLPSIILALLIAYGFRLALRLFFR